MPAAPAWSPSGFAQRVEMHQKAKLFLVVEGRDTDRWFYDEICSSSNRLEADGYEIYPVEQVSRGLRTGLSGGKDQVLALYKELKARGKLRVQSRTGSKSIMFIVDSDHDRVTGKFLKARHVTYTRLPDVEAHLHEKLDLCRVISRLMSVPRKDADKIVRSLGTWKEVLASNWRRWFELCLVADAIGLKRPVPGTPLSPLRDVDYGKYDRTKIARLQASLIKASGSRAQFKTIDQRCRAAVDRFYGSGNSCQLLKGKWISKYLHVLLRTQVVVSGAKSLRSEDATREAIKGSAMLTSATIRYYTTRIEAIL